MFASLRENINLKWDCIVEWYILKVDVACARMNYYTRSAQGKFEEISNRHDYPRLLLQLTLFGIILTFTVILFSCQSAPRPIVAVQPGKFDAARPERELDQLYIKRNEVMIKNTETGSSTGSIWADSREPRSLVVDVSPNKEGQTITVIIPDEFQFDPKGNPSDSPSPAKDKDKSKKPAGKENSEASQTADALKLTDPNEASPSQQHALRPIKSIKMQIVGFEPAGDVYLRGVRKYLGANGEEHTTMVLAKVPRRALTGFELDARELTDVAVNEDLNGRNREYSAPGWDEMVSRRLAGYTPDLNSELGTIDSLREEIKTAQASLRDQAKANELERDRIRKERNRMAAQGGATNQNANSSTSVPQSPSKTASADKKEGARE